MEGEELLNLFYHDDMLGRVGDAKEELCHAMWTSLITYNAPLVEQPCLVLLSNHAVYFLRAADADGKYNVCNIKHERLEQVCVGACYQWVRLGGSTTSGYYCCMTRDPALVHTFTSRLSFIIDTDFVKPFAGEGDSSDSEIEESIYDNPKEKHDHPSGVKFVHYEEKSMRLMKLFLIDSCDIDGTDMLLVSTDYIHVLLSSQQHVVTVALTNTAVHLVRELYAVYPMPECAVMPPDAKPYEHERTIPLDDVISVGLSSGTQDLVVELVTGDETLELVFCSSTLATTFLDHCSPLLSH